MPFDPHTFRLNSPFGKRILATTREGDYAHPGEEEAIHLLLEPFAGKVGRRWLDAGCGRGGTAAYVTQQGWAEVTGFDIDGTTICEAQTRFSETTLVESSVTDIAEHLIGPFDLIYSFNAFYAFPDQAAALRALRSVATESGPLALFDYVNRGGFFETDFAKLPEVAHWQPLEPATFADTLAANGWELVATQNLDADYLRWYEWLIARFDSRRAALLEFAPAEAIDHARHLYTSLRDAIRVGALGGEIVHARAIG